MNLKRIFSQSLVMEKVAHIKMLMEMGSLRETESIKKSVNWLTNIAHTTALSSRDHLPRSKVVTYTALEPPEDS